MTHPAPERTALQDALPAVGTEAPTRHELFSSFLRLGAVAFGGPAMVAYIRELAVDRKQWMRGDQFRDGVALCQALPGATAMQCAAYVGWKLRGLRGACAAYVGFGLPVVAAMMALSVLYQMASGLPFVAEVLVGIRGIVVALMANAAWTFGRVSVKRPKPIYSTRAGPSQRAPLYRDLIKVTDIVRAVETTLGSVLAVFGGVRP